MGDSSRGKLKKESKQSIKEKKKKKSFQQLVRERKILAGIQAIEGKSTERGSQVLYQKYEMRVGQNYLKKCLMFKIFHAINNVIGIYGIF